MKFLVKDQGIFVEMANRLADKGKNEVSYCTNWQKSSPQYTEFAPGVNFEYLKKEKYSFDMVEKSDCICNFDVYDNDEIKFLRKVYPNKSIFGSGHGERLENDRWKLKKTIQSLGLPLQKSWHIKGVTKLKKFLESNPNKYIKLNIFRADCESFFAKDYKSVEMRIKMMEIKFGPHSEEIEFVAEEIIKTEVEIGFDGFFNGVKYLDKCFLGYEYHKFFYLAKVVSFKDLPTPIKETMTKLIPVLQRMDYRGAISTEEKIVSQKEHYLLDVCSRLQSPGSVGYIEWIKNLPEVIYKTGLKQDVTPDIPYKYVGLISLKSDKAKDEYLYLDVKKENRDKIKFLSVCQRTRGGDYFSVKGMPDVAVPVATGNSVDEVIKKLKEYENLVDADELDKDVVNEMDVIKDIIKQGEKVGINF